MAADASEVFKLAADLTQAGVVASAGVGPVVSKGALNIKQDWRKAWSGIRHAPRLPQSITYDLDAVSGRGVEAEIGPETEVGQGFLGAVIHFGGVHNAPRPAGFEALAREEPRFVAALTALIEPRL